MAKTAILSNVNVDLIVKAVANDNEVYSPDGYGSVLEELINPYSGLNSFGAEYCFIIADIEELIRKNTDISEFLEMIRTNLSRDTTYYISDAAFRSGYCNISCRRDNAFLIAAEWNGKLASMISEHKNIRVFPYSEIVATVGREKFFNTKMWYMGRIIHSKEARNSIADRINYIVRLNGTNTQKKVLVLDLDNTLWGGICGEGDVTVSDEKLGLVYKELQQTVKRIQETGVILAIASKNNEADALKVFESNPQMILKKEDFVVRRINWDNKYESVKSMSEELNVGIDSMVFFDDSPMERELMKTQLPQTEVPDFPNSPEELPHVMEQIFNTWFKKSDYTDEDRKKTEQYRENAARNDLRSSAASFEEYLEQLCIKLDRADPSENFERIYHLIGKTNQFNLTTIRYTTEQLREMINSDIYRFYVYDVSDKFGDNGITAVAVVKTDSSPVIESFIMSCRIMGRRIENIILDIIEKDMKKEGYSEIIGKYIPTAKNAPCKDLYVNNGYEIMASDKTDDKEVLYKKNI